MKYLTAPSEFPYMSKRTRPTPIFLDIAKICTPATHGAHRSEIAHLQPIWTAYASRFREPSSRAGALRDGGAAGSKIVLWLTLFAWQTPTPASRLHAFVRQAGRSQSVSNSWPWSTAHCGQGGWSRARLPRRLQYAARGATLRPCPTSPP